MNGGENPLAMSPGLQPSGAVGVENLDPNAAREVAAAMSDAAKATTDLNRQIERTNRLTRDSPAVRAAREQGRAAKEQAAALGRGPGGAGVSRGGADRPAGSSPAPGESGVSRLAGRDLRPNRALEEAFGVMPSPAPGESVVRRPDPVAERAAQRVRDTGRDENGRPVGPLVPQTPPPLPGSTDAMRRSSTSPTLPPADPPPAPRPTAGFGERMGNGLMRGFDMAERGIMAGGNLAEAARLDGNDYMSRYEIQRRQAESIPIIGPIMGSVWAMQEASNPEFMKRDRAARELERMTMLRNEYTAAEAGPQADLIVRQMRARAALDIAEGPSGRPPPLAPADRFDALGRGTVDPARLSRDSVEERRRFIEASQVQPARDSAFIALNRQGVASREVERLTQAFQKMTADLATARSVAGRAQERYVEADAPGADGNYNRPLIRQRLTELTEARAKLSSIAEQRERVRGEIVNAQERLGEAREGFRASETVVRGRQLEVLAGREETARNQAERLGMMGFDGRIQTQLAKRLMNQVGIENLPGEIIGQVNAGFPETVRAEAQRAGQQFAPEMRQLGREEYRDDVKTIEKQVNDALKEQRDRELSQFGTVFENIIKTLGDYGGERLEALEKKLLDEIERLKSNERLRTLK